MTLPANIIARAVVQFPARAQGAGFITVTKSGGIFTIRADYTAIAALLAIPNAATKRIVVYDTDTAQYNTVTIAQIAAAAAAIVTTSGLTGAILNTYRIVTAAGDVTVNATTDEVILLNKSVPATSNIILPASSARVGVPVWVKDYARNAATYPATFVLNGTETIDGLGQAAADTAGLSKIDSNGGFKALYPLTSGGWYTLGAG